MRLFVLLSIMASVAAANDLTFDQAVSLAAARAPAAAAAPLASDLAALRRSRWPDVRLEVAGNTSRTLDLFSEGPFEVRYATSSIAFDYSLWDGGAMNARRAAVEAKMRRAAERHLDDARFAQLLDAFGELVLAQKQEEVVRPFADRWAGEADRSPALLASGDISNLTATERREAALGFRASLLELEARRVDAAARLRLLTGASTEPRAVLDVAQPVAGSASGTIHDDVVDALNVAVEESRARFREVSAASGFRATLSGFGGVGAADSRFRDVSSYGASSVYGLRVLFSYPLLRGPNELSLAEARVDLEQSLRRRDEALDAARARLSELRLRREALGKRIALLRQSADLSRQREESLRRLVSGGVRSSADLAQAESETARRETDLLAAQVDQWKAALLVARMTAP